MPTTPLNSQILRNMAKILKWSATDSSGLNTVAVVSKILKEGGVVAVPTDTIYGLASLCSSVDKLYQTKKRDILKPVAICVSSLAHVRHLANVTIADSLLEKLLPGPVTTVFERSVLVPSSINPETNLIGIRIPQSTFMRNLVDFLGEPLALTSANQSSLPSSLAIEDFEYLWPQLDLVVDGGRLAESESSRLGSTVIDFSIPGEYYIIRRGCAYEEVIMLLSDEKYQLKERRSL